jgi:hypothetical protein
MRTESPFSRPADLMLGAADTSSATDGSAIGSGGATEIR